MSELLRADALLVAKGLAETRSQARRLILDGRIQTADGQALIKPGQTFSEAQDFILIGGEPYVSRAGEKLAAFLKELPLDLRGKTALDLGASTGGFTDCLLRNGVSHVTCVDVGHGQLHPKIAEDSRITNLEGVNARELHNAPLPHEMYDVIVMDLSFISLTLVLPAAWAKLKPGGQLIALVKPQFEAGKSAGNKSRGVIRDPAVHQRVLNDIKVFASVLPGSILTGECPSPIKGGDGNKEFLMGWIKEL